MRKCLKKLTPLNFFNNVKFIKICNFNAHFQTLKPDICHFQLIPYVPKGGNFILDVSYFSRCTLQVDKREDILKSRNFPIIWLDHHCPYKIVHSTLKSCWSIKIEATPRNYRPRRFLWYIILRHICLKYARYRLFKNIYVFHCTWFCQISLYILMKM